MYRRLIAKCGGDHDRLIAQSGSAPLIRGSEYIPMHRNAGPLAADIRLAERYRQEFGVASEVLDRAALRRTEPALRADFAGAVHWQESCSCRDPGALVAAYAALFQRNGGTIVQAEVSNLTRTGAGWQIGLSDASALGAEHVIVALGAWSPEMLKPFGLRVPMVRKRGYHQHVAAKDYPTRPLFDLAASALYCPMVQGLRTTTGAEIAPLGRKPTGVQLARTFASARIALGLEEPNEPRPWSGWRPCLPDMLPAIGAVPGQKGLWCNFGHGHQGFTLCPTSDQVLATKMFGIGQADDFPELAPIRFA